MSQVACVLCIQTAPNAMNKTEVAVAMSNITIKRGDTLFLQCSVASNSLPQSLQNWQIKSTVKYGPRPVANLTVTKSSDSFTLQGSTANWPVGVLQCDIQYTTDAGVVISTETFNITTIQDVTS